MKVCTVVGARPQFVKAAALSRVLRRRHTEILVHTGQHHDREMSEVFFEELGIPHPERSLHIAGGSHGAQTGAMLAAVEAVLMEERPDVVVVFGDTNSTLAGALAAVKLSIPVAHIEAGLRSFDRRMPEEVNRVLTDAIATFLYVPSATAVENLAREGILKHVSMVGDVMIDSLRENAVRARAVSQIRQRLELEEGRYLVATIHRPSNSDHAANLASIFEAFRIIDQPVVLPLHPRTRKNLNEAGLPVPPNVRLVDPLGYLDMLALVAAARGVLTDSGGLQKEAYFLRVPCVTLRTSTEWVETVQTGWNTLTGPDTAAIVAAADRLAARPAHHPALFGDGHAAERIVEDLERNLVA